jgi:hypothetical protein
MGNSRHAYANKSVDYRKRKRKNRSIFKTINYLKIQH